MKKNLFIIVCVVLIVLLGVLAIISNLNSEKARRNELNNELENYTSSNLLGSRAYLSIK